MEMSLVLCSALTQLSGMFLWAWQPGQESIPQIPTGQVTPASLSQDAEGAPCSFPVPAPCVHEDFHRRCGVCCTLAPAPDSLPAQRKGQIPAAWPGGLEQSPMSCAPLSISTQPWGSWAGGSIPAPHVLLPLQGDVCPPNCPFPSSALPQHTWVPPFTNTPFQAPPVTFLPQCPPRSNFVSIHSDLNPEYPPQHNTAHPLSESPLFHTVIKTSLPSEQFFLFLVPLSVDPWNFQLSPTPSLRVTPCPPFFVSQAGLPQPG